MNIDFDGALSALRALAADGRIELSADDYDARVAAADALGEEVLDVGAWEIVAECRGAEWKIDRADDPRSGEDYAVLRNIASGAEEHVRTTGELANVLVFGTADLPPEEASPTRRSITMQLAVPDEAKLAWDMYALGLGVRQRDVALALLQLLDEDRVVREKMKAAVTGGRYRDRWGLTATRTSRG